MAGLFPKMALLAAVLALAGCDGGPWQSRRAGTEGAASAAGEGQITVTALDPAPAAAGGEAAAPGRPPGMAPVPVRLAGPDTPHPKPRPPDGGAARPGSAAVPRVAEAGAADSAGAPAAPTAAEAVPEAAKSPARLACEKRRGQWVETGKTGIFGCITYTKDALKECRNSRQCEGQCLARSGTCAPYQPLFGCYEILDDTGRRMTQCLD